MVLGHFLEQLGHLQLPQKTKFFFFKYLLDIPKNSWKYIRTLHKRDFVPLLPLKMVISFPLAVSFLACHAHLYAGVAANLLINILH